MKKVSLWWLPQVTSQLQTTCFWNTYIIRR
jgi:hypothetical protein